MMRGTSLKMLSSKVMKVIERNARAINAVTMTFFRPKKRTNWAFVKKATPKERKMQWLELENIYQPGKNYDNLDFLKNGGFWQKQAHIYEMPFYYIDYTLAQVCAFQFWIRMKEDKESAWNDYLKLCKAGGSMSFLDLVKLANIKSPFDPKVFEEVATKINNWLSKNSL